MVSAPAALPPLRDVIALFDLQAKKALGQHFLTDANLLAKVVRAAGSLDGMLVVEVGPGPGGLSRAILESPARALVAIEMDARCVPALQNLQDVYGPRFTLQQGDALKQPLASIGEGPRAVVANLPYNVGTQLVVNWLQEVAQHGRAALQHFTVMLQKEVAERMVAKVGDAAYGRLSVLLQQFTDAEMMFDVPPGAFSPPPKVVSSVLHARVLERPREDVPLKALEQVVAAAFNHRRKMLRQSLKSLEVDAVGWCERAGIDPTLRAENCTLAMFADLVRAREALR